MRFPEAFYQLQRAITQHLPSLRPAQQRGLALWVFGTLLAHSSCQSAVVLALSVYGSAHALRQRLRDWLYDGSDKAAPCHIQIAPATCFAALLRWVLSWWQEGQLALALDATLDRDRMAALVISVLYRGSAIPVAWAILPANTKGAWMPHILPLLRLLWRAVPRQMPVLVLIDRGLWSPVLWRRIRRLGWHPLVRIRASTAFTAQGGTRQKVRNLVPGPGYAWVGAGRAGREKGRRHPSTLVVVWDPSGAEPWVVLTDLPPQQVGLGWYGLRMWIELGFRALKGVGWRWEHTRRLDPTRAARHWLVLAVAMLWVLATGTRVEDAERAKVAPGRLRRPSEPPAVLAKRSTSVWSLGCLWAQRQAIQGRFWSRLWLWPEPWPQPPPGIQLLLPLPF
jgi:hypothetical protein